MIINDLNDFQLIKYLLNKEYILQKDLSDKLNLKTGKNTKPGNFSAKLKRNYLTCQELRYICDILGYDLIIRKKSQ
ncbi:LLM class flavin-dependent oxidoreductase [bacterium]|nr:LLM class flavin-dependent oxidoreductase [bacterium]